MLFRSTPPLAIFVYDRWRRRRGGVLLVTLGGLWLLFFPNAPYLVTDLMHVGRSARVPVLYDVVLLAAGAWAGLLLGLTSLFLVHAVARRLTSAVNAWALVVGVLAVSSFGIYLGRVERWNSWDVVVRPHSLGHQLSAGVLHPLSHPRPLALTVLLASFLLVSYLVFYSFVRVSYLERE